MFELMKYIRADALLKTMNIELLKLSGFLFTAAIITNFISQITGKASNSEEARYAGNKILEIRHKPFDKKKMEWADFWGEFYGRITEFANILSTIAMIAGVLLLSAFGFANF
jgi:hypothetical protein